MKMLCQEFDNLSDPIWGAIMSRYQDEEMIDELKEVLPEIEDFFIQNLKTQKFFGGDHPMYLDIHCYPHLERLILLENSPW